MRLPGIKGSQSCNLKFGFQKTGRDVYISVVQDAYPAGCRLFTLLTEPCDPRRKPYLDILSFLKLNLQPVSYQPIAAFEEVQ